MEGESEKLQMEGVAADTDDVAVDVVGTQGGKAAYTRSSSCDGIKCKCLGLCNKK
jgi:hypothetical protein